MSRETSDIDRIETDKDRSDNKSHNNDFSQSEDAKETNRQTTIICEYSA